MALWYETGNGPVKTSFAKKSHNSAAFVCCGGPSLKDIDPKILNGPNRTVFALNNTYPFVRPDIWIGMDDPLCYDRKLFNEPFVKIMRGGYQNRFREDKQRIDGLFNMFYADVKKPNGELCTFKLRAHDVNFVWLYSTISTALHIIVWMGFQKIYLFGNDLNNTKGDYHDKTVNLSKINKDNNTRFYDQVYDYLKRFSEIGKKYNIQLISCSKNSRANDYLDYVDYRYVIGELEKTLPETPELYHATDAEKIWDDHHLRNVQDIANLFYNGK